MKTKLTKLGFAVFLILIGVTLTVCNAHALDPYPDTTPLVGVSSDGGVNITQRTTFDWNETPWTKVSFLKNDIDNWGQGGFELHWTWKYNSISKGTHTLTPIWYPPGTSDPVVFTHSPGSADWSGMREIGSWTLETKWHYMNLAEDAWGDWEQGKTVPFTVTPEPLSSTLFLLGGTTIVLARRRRLKRTRT